MRKRAAILLALSFVVACGGSATTTGASSAPFVPATATTAPATSAAASAKPSTAADASTQLVALLGLAKNATYKITYKTTVSGSGAGLGGDQTWYFKPPRSRFDFTTPAGSIAYFNLPEGQFFCIVAAVAFCQPVAGTGSPLDQNAVVAAQQSLIGDPSAFSATSPTSKTIAGQTATCFDVTSKSGGTVFDSGTFCYTSNGVPLLSTFSTPQYASWSMEATSYSATVADSDFVLPAKPLGR